MRAKTPPTEALEKFSPEKLALLRKLLSERGAKDAPPALPVPRPDPLDPCLLSPGQERLWFMESLNPGTSYWNDALVVRIEGGPMDSALFEQALHSVARRHEAFRLRFLYAADGSPRQQVDPEAKFPFEFMDFRDLSPPLRAQALAKAERDLVATPFALDQPPMARSVLIRLADTLHVFGCCMHHIISDGYSYGVFYRELGATYAALLAGQEPELAELPFQLCDLAIWERQWTDHKKTAKDLEFWRSYLASLPKISLPWDRPAKPGPHPPGAFHTFRFPAELREQMRRFCGKEKLTSNWVMLATWLLLLRLESGETDQRLGLPLSTRNQPELEQLIAFLVQTLVVRCDFSDDPNFQELLARVRKAAVEAERHSAAPFEEVVQLLRKDGLPEDAEVIPAWFTHMENLISPLEIPGTQTHWRILESGHTRFDISLIVDVNDEEIFAYFEYNTDRFEEGTVARLAGRYLDLLRQMMEKPETRPSDLAETDISPTKPKGPAGFKRRSV